MRQDEEATDEHEQTIKDAGYNSADADVRTDSSGHSGTSTDSVDRNRAITSTVTCRDRGDGPACR